MDEMTALERQLEHGGCFTTSWVPSVPSIRPRDPRCRRRGASNPYGPTGSSAFHVLRFVVAAVIVALFGGFLLLGVLTNQPSDDIGPAASPPPLVGRFTDPVGDVQRSIGVRPVDEPHGDEPDIVAVTSTATVEDVVLEVELLDDWVLAESTLWFSLFPDPVATYQRDEPLPGDPLLRTRAHGAWLRIEVTERPGPQPRRRHRPTPGAGHRRSPRSSGRPAPGHSGTGDGASDRTSSGSTCRTRSAASAFGSPSRSRSWAIPRR